MRWPTAQLGPATCRRALRLRSHVPQRSSTSVNAMPCNPVSECAVCAVQHYTHAAQQQAAQRHYDRHFSRREAEVRESVHRSSRKSTAMQRTRRSALPGGVALQCGRTVQPAIMNASTLRLRLVVLWPPSVRWRRAVRWPRLRTTASHSRATAPMRRSEETSASRRALVLPQYLSSTRHAVPN
jgi:hypothetical protein